MKILAWAVLACGALASTLWAGESTSTPRESDVARQLNDLEEQWVKAEISHDASTLWRILDVKFISTFGTVQPLDREEFIKTVTDGEVDPSLTQTLSDRTIRVEGDTAVLVETDTIRRMKNGRETASAWRVTVTYIRRDGQWRALAEHMVKVPPPGN